MNTQLTFESALHTKTPNEIAMHYDKKYRAKYRSIATRLRRTFLIIFLVGLFINALFIISVRTEKSIEAFSQPVPQNSSRFLFTENTPDLDTMSALPVQTSEQKQTINNSYVSLGLPADATGEFKTYMDYKKITDQTSKQWYLQQLAHTNEKGFRMFNGRYLVAVGTYYSKEIGKELLITLDSGVVVEAIVGDIKMDKHTDKNNQYVPVNGNIVEFIVDTLVLDKKVQSLGDVSCLGLDGKITSIEVRKND
jgi:hypothetical protein